MFDPNHFSLHAKQTEIDDKKEMCEIQIDKFEDDIEALDITVPDVEKSIVEDKENDSVRREEGARGYLARGWK